MQKKLKRMLIPVLLIALVALGVIGVNLYNKIKEEKRIEQMNEGFRPENLRGLWEVQGEDFNLFFYLDNDMKMHIRSSYGFDPNGTKPMTDVVITNSTNGNIGGLQSTNGSETAISLSVKNENVNSYTVRLTFSDMKNGFKTLYMKDVEITKSSISFDNSGREELTKTITELLIEKFNNYNGERYVPINVTLHEASKTDGLVSGGQVSGEATMVKPGFSGTDGLNVAFDLEVANKPFQFRQVVVNGNYFIHNYKTEQPNYSVSNAKTSYFVSKPYNGSVTKEQALEIVKVYNSKTYGSTGEDWNVREGIADERVVIQNGDSIVRRDCYFLSGTSFEAADGPPTGTYIVDKTTGRLYCFDRYRDDKGIGYNQVN